MEEDDDVSEMYSITSSKAIYRRGPIRESEGTLLTVTSSERPRRIPSVEVRRPSKGNYWKKIDKYEVDYNNQNYVRSKCNKPTGLHRKVVGRPYMYNVQYDNNYFTKSQVNAPLGKHRTFQIRGKLVPDDDFLADSTGWEFDYGPEFLQVEEDIPYIPEGKIIARGCFRCYGVKRNKSDMGGEDMDEFETELSEEMRERLKYGMEYCQLDKPLIREIKDCRISRGAYGHYDVDRNYYDLYPDDLKEVEYDLERERQKLKIAEDMEKHRKGKPFKRTILNKVYEMGKPKSLEKVIHVTELSFVPGEGEQTFYEGKPATKTVYKAKRSSLAGSYSTDKGSYRDLNAHESWERSARSSRSGQESVERVHRHKINVGETRNRRRGEQGSEFPYLEGQEDLFKKMPPHIEERVNRIRSKMTKQMDHTRRNRQPEFDSEDRTIDEEIDFTLKKPRISEIKGFEKYVKDNGSEVWIRTEEKMSRK